MTATLHDPIETALLARLLVSGRKAPTQAEIVKSLRPLFEGADPTRTTTRLEATLTRLETEGLRTSDMKLTASGRARVCEALGLSASNVPTRWRAVKSLLVEIALDRRSSKKGRRLSASAMRAAALARKLGIATAATSPAAVLDAWAAREIGMSDQRLTIANVRAHVLSRALGIETLRDPKRIGAVASAKVLGVARNDADTVRDAVLRDWLRDPKIVDVSPSVDDLQGFASAVKEAARATTGDGRFGRFKVFIAPLWARARSVTPFAHMSEGDFKAKLVEAHRAGLLHLTRADLTPAMAPHLVAASEVPYLNAVFHFVDLEGTLS